MCGVIVVRRWIRFRFRISEETLSGMGLQAKRWEVTGGSDPRIKHPHRSTYTQKTESIDSFLCGLIEGNWWKIGGIFSGDTEWGWQILWGHENKVCVSVYACVHMNWPVKSTNLSQCFDFLSPLSHTLWPLRQWCSSPASAYCRQMVVCFTVHLHPDWFICLSVLVPSHVCSTSSCSEILYPCCEGYHATICWIIDDAVTRTFIGWMFCRDFSSRLFSQTPISFVFCTFTHSYNACSFYYVLVALTGHRAWLQLSHMTSPFAPHHSLHLPS